MAKSTTITLLPDDDLGPAVEFTATISGTMYLDRDDMKPPGRG